MQLKIYKSNKKGTFSVKIKRLAPKYHTLS